MSGLRENDVVSERLGDVAPTTRTALECALGDQGIDDDQALHLIQLPPESLAPLLAVAGHVRTRRKGRTITYSPKVFLPITNLCRNFCSYCTFRKNPGDPAARTMGPDDVREQCRRARVLGCTEALLCLGDKPELAFPSYRETLDALGHRSTVDYLEHCARIALDEGLLPHTNAGVLSRDDMRRLKPLNVSFGLMLESVSPRLCAPGGPHHHAPDKRPERRLQMIREAGELRIAFTTGILIGIGETPAETVASLRAIADLHAEHGHIQEIIIQNFRAKPDTRMAGATEPDRHEMARTIAVARLLCPDMNLQAPPNLSPADHRLFLAAGINDWGGISPLTHDFVNPEAPWPHIEALAATCRDERFTLAPRLPVYPEFLRRPGFVDSDLAERAHRISAESGRPHAG